MHNNNDISLKQLLLKLNDYRHFYLKRWKLLAAVALVSALALLFLNLNQSKRYTASLTFMLNVDERGLSAGVSSLLGQFGLGVGGTESNLDKILKLSQARVITEKTVFDSFEINNKNDFLANHIIASLEENKKWGGQGGFLSFDNDSLNVADFRFTDKETDSFSLLENKALKKLHNILMGSKDNQAMFTSEYDELTGIMTLHMTAPDEALSIRFVNGIFDNLSEYYIEKSTEKQKYEYDILREKYDSINSVLRNVQYRLASFEDNSKAIFRKTDILEKNRLKVEEQKLQFILAKAEEQLQIAKIALDNKTPYIQVIDKPISPIKADNKSPIFFFVLGGILGLLAVMLVLGAQKMIKDILSQEL